MGRLQVDSDDSARKAGSSASSGFRRIEDTENPFSGEVRRPLSRPIRIPSIVASSCLWQRAISCTCEKEPHHHCWRIKVKLDAFPGWREENDQNFHEAS